MLLFGCGCAQTDRGSWHCRTGPVHPPMIKRNGEQLTPDRDNCVMVYGRPTFTFQIPEGQVCIWRDFAPGLQKKGDYTLDYIMTFDVNGKFLPTDLNADYGFCRRCFADLRGMEGKQCPDCQRPANMR